MTLCVVEVVKAAASVLKGEALHTGASVAAGAAAAVGAAGAAKSAGRWQQQPRGHCVAAGKTAVGATSATAGVAMHLDLISILILINHKYQQNNAF